MPGSHFKDFIGYSNGIQSVVGKKDFKTKRQA
jgi:hypothetical protein